MPRDLSRIAFRASLGFVGGLVVWKGLSVPYATIMAALTEIALRIAEWPAIVQMTTTGTLLVVDRSDIARSPDGMQFAVESTDLTFNIIVLLTLFAARRYPLEDRNVFGFAGAAVALLFVHVAAAMSFVQAHYATSFGTWSSSHYGPVTRGFWKAVPYFYSIAGGHGSALALWWLFRPPPESENERVRRDERTRPRRSRRSDRKAGSRVS